MFRALILSGLLALPTTAMAQDLSPDEVKKLALEAILENPEIVMQAVEILRTRDAQAAEAAARLAPLAGREFLTAHDAYQYFEARFGLTSHAAITDAEDAEAGPAHLREVLASSDGLGCFSTEPSTPSASIRLVTETLSIPAVEIDRSDVHPHAGSRQQFGVALGALARVHGGFVIAYNQSALNLKISSRRRWSL